MCDKNLDFKSRDAEYCLCAKYTELKAFPPLPLSPFQLFTQGHQDFICVLLVFHYFSLLSKSLQSLRAIYLCMYFS